MSSPYGTGRQSCCCNPKAPQAMTKLSICGASGASSASMRSRSFPMAQKSRCLETSDTCVVWIAAQKPVLLAGAPAHAPEVLGPPQQARPRRRSMSGKQVRTSGQPLQDVLQLNPSSQWIEGFLNTFKNSMIFRVSGRVPASVTRWWPQRSSYRQGNFWRRSWMTSTS